MNKDVFDIQNYLDQGRSVYCARSACLYHTKPNLEIDQLFIQFISEIITSLPLCRISLFEYFTYFFAVLGYEIIFSGRHSSKLWSVFFGERNLDNSSCITSAWSSDSFLPVKQLRRSPAFLARHPWVPASRTTPYYFTSRAFKSIVKQ